MPSQINHAELELFQAFKQGRLKSIVSKNELTRFKAVAKATGVGNSGNKRYTKLAQLMLKLVP